MTPIQHPAAVDPARPKPQNGFTLIEVMIVVAIVAILAAIALPSYRDYVLRGQLVDATNLLSAGRVNMERYYQDNRTYAAVPSTTITPPCGATQGLFTMSCTATSATGYTLSATATTSGSAVAGFTYTVTESDARTTVIAAPAPWTPRQTYYCYIVKRGQAC